MGLLSTIFGGDLNESLDCPHARLIPRWRGPQVMEDDAQAMGFVCQDCGSEFLTYRVRDRRLRTR